MPIVRNPILPRVSCDSRVCRSVFTDVDRSILPDGKGQSKVLACAAHRSEKSFSKEEMIAFKEEGKIGGWIADPCPKVEAAA